MTDGGFEWTIYEIFEASMAVVLLLVLSLAIIVVPQPEYEHTYTINKEMSYILNLVSDTDMNVNVNYPETRISTQGNKVFVKYKDVELENEYFGDPVKIEKEGSNYKIIPS